MITTKIPTDVLMTGAPLMARAADARVCAPVAGPVAGAAVTGLEGHVSLQDVTPAKRDRIVTTDVFTTVPGLPAWSPPT